MDDDKSDKAKDRRWTAQSTLWILVETRLQLLHPKMPFVAEGLWQRLLGRGTFGDCEVSSWQHMRRIRRYPNPKKETTSTVQIIEVFGSSKLSKGTKPSFRCRTCCWHICYRLRNRNPSSFSTSSPSFSVYSSK